MSRYKSKASGTPEVHNARCKLDGLLQTLMDQKEDSPIKEEPVYEPESTSAPTTPKKGAGGGRTSRKRKRGKEDLLPMETTQYHDYSYVMRLFDRSVDLAQFQDASPLYPICRAWMKNQPSNRTLAPQGRTHTPDPTEGGDVDENGVPLVYSLPKPVPIKSEDGLGEIDLRIPAPIPQTDDPLDIHSDVSQAPPSEHLLLNHMIRWKQVRQSWKDAARLNEMRYGDSMRTLKDMFDRQCKDA